MNFYYIYYIGCSVSLRIHLFFLLFDNRNINSKMLNLYYYNKFIISSNFDDQPISSLKEKVYRYKNSNQLLHI